MVVEVSTSPTLQIGSPVMLFPGGTNLAGSPRPLYDVTADGFTADPDRLARFEREAKVLASLNHPNIGTFSERCHFAPTVRRTPQRAARVRVLTVFSS